MNKWSVIFLLSCALVSNSLVINSYGQPVATSYSYREDGNEKGHGYGYGYSKNYGYGKVIVATYLAPAPPQMMPASSYSTYIIHPVNMKGCVHEVMDNEDAGSYRRDYEVTEDMPSMSESSNEYSEPKFDADEDAYENMLNTDTDRGWYKDYRNEDNGEAYWDKLKREFDEYYNKKYREMFGEDEDEDEDNDEDKRYESEYKLPFKYQFVGEGEDSGEDDAAEPRPEFGFDPASDGFGYRYEAKDKYGRRW